MAWAREEARPRNRRRKESGAGIPWDKKNRKTEEEMDGLCQPGHDSSRDDNNNILVCP